MQIQSIIRPMQEFGPCLKQLLQEKGISASELARIMAYKSRNSIFRILDGVGAQSARQAFYDRLLQEDPLKLSEQERAALEQALEISRVGLMEFLNNRAMSELLMDNDMEDCGAEVVICLDEDEQLMLESYADKLKLVEDVRLTITGCCDRGIISTIAKCLCKPEAQDKVKITHFVYTGEEEIVRNISAIQPLLYESCYEAYALEPGVCSREKQRAYRNNCVFLHARDKQGNWINRSLILVDKGCFLLMRTQDIGGFAMLEKLFERDITDMLPLKKVFTDAADYAAYTQECLRLEQGRAIYMIKRDIPLSYVQTDILLSCLLDGFAASGEQACEQLKAHVDHLEQIQKSRFDNFFHKRRPTHTVFSREAMRKFAETGRQSDHFFAFRTYTPGERVRILTHLREQAEENPHFHVYFFRPEYEAPQMEIALYEGVGTLMAKPNTHYDLAGDHAEALIEQEAFCASYKAYFVGDVLEKRVLGREETLAALDQLIEIAENAE